MKQSTLFFKTRKETPSDADSINASYLIRAGFVEKLMAGVYAALPLGFKVQKKIENIIRNEMDAVGGQEILMNVLQPKELWEETGRWKEMEDIFYKLADAKEKEIGLAPTHEEQITDIVRKKVNSYKDLPLSLYQIQTKFRNEPRAKSGLLRGREFIMKDLYSFHDSEEDLDKYYNLVIDAYFKVFKRCGLDAKIVEASGGSFSKYSHEFQVISPAGEDEIFYCNKCDFAQNKEVAEVKEGDECPKCEGKIKKDKAIEVGNIFKLKTRYSSAMGAKFADQNGKLENIIMASYGIGVTRCLATIVELNYEASNNKMVWPEEVAPFKIHLLSLNQDEEAGKIYQKLLSQGVEVLYDDRDITAGEKFAEADLIGCPIRIVVSKRTLESKSVEFTSEEKTENIAIENILHRIQ